MTCFFFSKVTIFDGGRLQCGKGCDEVGLACGRPQTKSNVERLIVLLDESIYR